MSIISNLPIFWLTTAYSYAHDIVIFLLTPSNYNTKNNLTVYNMGRLYKSNIW